MPDIVTQNPGSAEAQSPLIAGLSEGLNKISSILNLREATFKDVRLDPVSVDNRPENKNRIYEIPFGQKLWLRVPTPTIKKNGIEIRQESLPFTIDYIGGSITFLRPLEDEDTITASATYITGSSTTVETLANLLNQVKIKSEQYKGYFETLIELESQISTGKEGDIAFVATPQFAIYSWDKSRSKWRNTQSIEDLTDYYTAEEVDTRLNQKEPIISKKGASATDKRYFWNGNKEWKSFDETARTVSLKGLSSENSEPVSPEDTLLQAIGKLVNSAQILREKGFITGTGSPTTSTIGKVGQRYVNTSTGIWYTCTGASEDSYTWKPGANQDEVDKKVDKIKGKGLSSNDFTDEEKEKLSKISSGTEKEEIKRIFTSGFADGTKTFSEDGTVITSTSSDGRTLTKTFTDSFSTLTAVLSDSEKEIARMIKTFAPDGSINTEFIYKEEV